MNADPPASCHVCGSPTDRDQRYCLACGERLGGHSSHLVKMLARRHADQPPKVQPHERPPGHRRIALTLPSPQVCLVLVLGFLGFGVLIGHTVSSPVNATLAASQRPRLDLVVPPSDSSTQSATTPEAGGGESESQPPPINQAASEPEPAETSTQSTSSPSSHRSTSEKKPAKKTRKTSKESAGSSGESKGGSASKLPKITHVFLIVLSDEPYASVFGPSSSAPYLAHTLEKKGELLVRYYAVAHQELANAIALVSGQGPTSETAANCPNYGALTQAAVGADEQVTGTGCVYPSSTQTLVGQLAAKHLPWRAYVEGMGESSSNTSAAGAGGSANADGVCGHPVLGAADPTSAATPPAGQPYATYRNPFVYFSSITGAPLCEFDDVGINELPGDLAAPNRTPSLAYIVPDRCHDANPTPCSPGAPAGLPAAESFLKRVVPKILGSKAYKESGLLVITVDQAPSSGPLADSSSCCGQPQFPNLPASNSGLSPEGGGQVGALLLSPFIHSSAVNQTPYNHFSLLRTIEDLFELSHLGYAALPKVTSLEPSIFTTGK